MSVDIKSVGGIPTRVWDRQASLNVGQAMVATVTTRAFVEGRDINERLFRRYNTTRPVWLPVNDRPKPVGGRLSRTGKTMRFDSYAAYKRRTLGTTKVNLTKSGRLLRSYRVKRASSTELIVGPNGDAIIYGNALQRRGFLWNGLSDRDQQRVAKAIAREIAGAMARSVKK
ncbi:MAG: hypothetical protein KC583_00775 [Myxococcales bacterium]|nr:hypothetical protein [Myxococcales bacterium]